MTMQSDKQASASSVSRRSALTNVTTAALASIIPLAPAAATGRMVTPPPDFDREKWAAECLSRFEHMLLVLRVRFICDGWSIDESGATRALAYLRRWADGLVEEESEEALAEVKAFMDAHGQSMDWLLTGANYGMISELARYSPRATEQPAESNFLALEAEIDRLNEAKSKIYEAAVYPQDGRAEQLLKQGGRTRSQRDYDTMVRFDRESGRAAGITEGDALLARANVLIEQVWETPCRSDADRLVKTRIFLKHVARKEWLGPDSDLDWETRLARTLLVELSGMNAAEAVSYTLPASA